MGLFSRRTNDDASAYEAQAASWRASAADAERRGVRAGDVAWGRSVAAACDQQATDARERSGRRWWQR